MTYLIALILSAVTLASVESTNLRMIVQIHESASGPQFFSTKDNQYIPSVAADQKIKNLISNLPFGSYAAIEGKIQYEVVSSESNHKLRPYFLIHSFHPVSLTTLGYAGNFVIEENSPKILSPLYYPAPTIPVTTEVASSIILTSAFMMMESLSSSSNDANLQRDLQKTLILSTGSLATLLFIYEQIQGKKDP